MGVCVLCCAPSVRQVAAGVLYHVLARLLPVPGASVLGSCLVLLVLLVWVPFGLA